MARRQCPNRKRGVQGTCGPCIRQYGSQSLSATSSAHSPLAPRKISKIQYLTTSAGSAAALVTGDGLTGCLWGRLASSGRRLSGP